MSWIKALGWFVAAYIAVTIVATGFSVMVQMAMQTPMGPSPVQNPAYIVAQRFLPLINLIVWMAFAGLYFRRRPILRDEALKLGAVWLGLAVLVDYGLFVRTETPISLSPHEFYVGQFPWIYLIYVAVAVAPVCWGLITGRLGGRETA